MDIETLMRRVRERAQGPRPAASGEGASPGPRPAPAAPSARGDIPADGPLDEPSILGLLQVLAASHRVILSRLDAAEGRLNGLASAEAAREESLGRLAGAVERLDRGAVPSLERKIDAFGARLDSLGAGQSRDVLDLRSRLDGGLARLDRLEEALAEGRREAAAAGALGADIQDLRATLDTLEAGRSQDVLDLRSRLEGGLARLDRLEEALAEAGRGAAAAGALGADIQDLRATLDSLEAGRSQDVVDLRSHLDGGLARLDRLKEAVAEAGRGAASAGALGADIQDLRSALEGVRAGSRQDVVDLRSRLDGGLARLDQLEEAVAEAGRGAAAAGALGADIQDLRSALEGVRAGSRQDVEDLRSRLDDGLAQDLRSALEGVRAGSRQDVEDLRSRLDDGLAAVRSDAAAASARSESVESSLTRQLAEVQASLAAVDERVPRREPSGAAPFDYLGFEMRFRGSPEDIQNRQRRYFELFANRRRVVDLGSGRGEFVHLLKSAQVDVTGVDSNEAMLRWCRNRDLPVVDADVLRYLESLPDASVDGIFSAQVVEHMDVATLTALIRQCDRVLEPGGVLVVETLNPDCDLAMRNFYLDPTHVRPVPGRLLQFLMEQGRLRVESFLLTAPRPGSAVEPVLRASAGWPEGSADYLDYASVAFRV